MTCRIDCQQGRTCPHRTRRELPAWAWFIAAIIAGSAIGFFALHLIGVTAGNAAAPIVSQY